MKLLLATYLSRHMITAHIRRHRAVIQLLLIASTDEVFNTTAAPDKSKEVNQKQVGAIAEDMTFVLIACIVTECGGRLAPDGASLQILDFFVPWHSSRSIQT